jgi:hypothetical protein
VVGVSAGTGIGVSGSSGTFTVSNTGDLSATNELNTSFYVSGSNLALTDAGGTINVAVSSIAPVQAVSAGTGISISGTTNRTITNTGDLSATNEIQTLSLSGSDLSLSLGGGTVTLPGGADGNGIYSGDGTIPAGTIATWGAGTVTTTWGGDGYNVNSWAAGDYSSLAQFGPDGTVLLSNNSGNSHDVSFVFIADDGLQVATTNTNQSYTTTSGNITYAVVGGTVQFDAGTKIFTLDEAGDKFEITDNGDGLGMKYSAEYPNILTNDLSIPYIKLIKEMPKLLREVSDATAQNQEQYYSTTRSKVCYKTSGGTVIELH